MLWLGRMKEIIVWPIATNARFITAERVYNAVVFSPLNVGSKLKNVR
jgi:hypothetical protein